MALPSDWFGSEAHQIAAGNSKLYDPLERPEEASIKD